ncbi:hypothetical protein GGR50DRAFT_688668 [Xylaria sp. CBS 124048]|nr:hypothetical protein GGR50DRAFT_688668 [Xylaria sp. CBS 124048]
MPVPFRIPVPLRGEGHLGIDAALPILVSRQYQLPQLQLSRRDAGNARDRSTVIIVIAIVLIIISAGVGFLILQKCRRDRRRKYQEDSHLEPYSGSSSATRSIPGGANAVSEANRNGPTANVDRNTSIRSIMTLPKYSNTANEGEQIIGRGGERDGVDIIIEMPSPTTQEALRDEEMETMYRIRLARRHQNAEREERRRLMQEARDRGDRAAIEELRNRRRVEPDNTTVDELREVQSQIRYRRERAVSSVSYHDLGVARHDGSRIRANSSESERMGLLSDAASIAVSTRSPSALSNHRVSDSLSAAGPDIRSSSAHSRHRIRSVSSVLSLDENGETSHSPGMTTPRIGRSHTRAGSSPEIVTEADLGDSLIPPPDYEELSLDDGRSGTATPIPINEPPPDYSQRNSENEGATAAAAAAAAPVAPVAPAAVDDDRNRPTPYRYSRGFEGIPRLPSLRIRELPQIVIEPTTSDFEEITR